jgi:hypothetical protein
MKYPVDRESKKRHTLHLLLSTLDISARAIQIVSARTGQGDTQVKGRSALGHDVDM